MAKWIANVTWEDVPHIKDDVKKDMYRSYSPEEREARSKGIPSIGSGRIYPVLEGDFLIPPFKIPAYWPKAFALDVGFNRTAAIWGAIDPDSGIIYFYDEYYCGQALPEVHAAAIKRRGTWIPGAIDPSSRNGSVRDGRKLIDEYRGLGLDVSMADNAIEAGILKVLNLLSTGRIKLFLNCQNTLQEFRVYRYDDSGKPARNQDDHLMDALRYWVMTAKRRAITKPEEDEDLRIRASIKQFSRDDITGY